jgi:N-acetylmuramic acid 6-phosphate etherase
MVNVQPTNRKLEDRARRMITHATGITYERAVTLLEEAGRDVRTAIVMEKRGVDRAEAERLLAAAGGRISRAVTKGSG